MIWYCDKCAEWGEASTAVDIAVDRQNHLDNRHGPYPAHEEPEHVQEDPDTVLPAKYLLWGIAGVLGLLSGTWPVLGYLAPFAVLLALIVGYQEH